jgi:CHAD domain-containing protein
MSYRIALDESIGGAARRIAREQVEKALTGLNQEDESIEERIHQFRKRCKKLRALFRLVRPGFDGYREANATFRDLARLVSEERDARVTASLVSKLAGEDNLDAPVVRWFGLKCELAEALAEPLLGRIVTEMRDAAVRLERWSLVDLTIDDVIEGLQKTLGRAHKELGKVRINGGVGDYHSFRKRSKYHWYHLQLLEEILEGGGDARRDKFDELGDLIGEAHDRSVLVEQLCELPIYLKRDPIAQKLEAEALRTRRELRREALARSRELSSESAEHFADSLRSRWRHLVDSRH